MDMREQHQYCLNKLSTQLHQKTKRDVFVPVCEGEPINLMHAISLSRVKSSATANQRIIAEALFMSVTELNDAKNCAIGPTAAYLGMCVRVLWRAKFFITADPIVFPGTHPLLALITPLLKIAERERSNKRGRGDTKFLMKLSQQVKNLREGAEGELLKKLDQIVAVISRSMSN
jgi:hypothetical protein